ncbi:MAG: tetratricopeptide repeat-containing glycosyltransferase family protein [Gallionellaceae bacterium]
MDQPINADAYYKQGNLQQHLQRYQASLESYNMAIALRPDYAEAYNNRGSVLQNLGQHSAALEDFDKAIALKSDYAYAYYNRGISLHGLKRLEQALASYDRAIALNPGYAEAYSNRGNVLQELKRLEEALLSYDRAIALNPAYAEAYNNRGNALKDLMRLDEAGACFDRAIALNYAPAYWNKSLLDILTGNFDEGWQLYEWRWNDSQKDFARNFSKPLWLGQEAVAGKTLLIHAEQGLGDFIQFCRYALMLEALGAKVILEVPSVLVALISTLEGNFTVVEHGRLLPAFDLHCPVMSLPLAFKTRVENIPAPIPYLHADFDKHRRWHQKIGNTTKPRVGLVWSGNTAHKNDRNRSIPLLLFESLLQLPIEFHVLQKEIQPDDAAVLTSLRGLHLHHDELNDFADTAALVQEMNLVISVDTSVAHLAGAMGKPVWILLPFMPDYRWMLGSADCPWYPTATLFRQPESGDWSSVITEVGMQLRLGRL